MFNSREFFVVTRHVVIRLADSALGRFSLNKSSERAKKSPTVVGLRILLILTSTRIGGG